MEAEAQDPLTLWGAGGKVSVTAGCGVGSPPARGQPLGRSTPRVPLTGLCLAARRQPGCWCRCWCRVVGLGRAGKRLLRDRAVPGTTDFRGKTPSVSSADQAPGKRIPSRSQSPQTVEGNQPRIAPVTALCNPPFSEEESKKRPINLEKTA